MKLSGKKAGFERLLTPLLVISVMFLILSFVCRFLRKQPENRNGDSSVSKMLVQNMSFLRPFELQSEDCQLSIHLRITDEQGQAASCRDLPGDNKSILIYRFAETHCDLCIEQHLMILKNLEEKIDPDRLVLPGSYTNAKKVKIVCQAHNMNFRTYNTMDNIGIPLEQTGNPYFFILDRDMKCHSVFSAIKENPDLTISCIHAILEKMKSEL